MFKKIWHWIKFRYKERWLVRRIEITEQEFLPAKLPKRNLVLVREAKEDWSVGFVCPCGCQRRIELLLIPEAKPHWQLAIDEKNRPTLWPSVWLEGGCRSHFWIRAGRIIWVR